MTTGATHASSIVVLEAMTEPVGPSMVLIEDHQPAAMRPSTAETAGTVVSPSIIALGEPLPDVTYEKVSAVEAKPEKPQRRRPGSPMVMRGGIVGDAFPAGTYRSGPADEPQPAVAETPASDAQPEQAAEAPPPPASDDPEIIER